MNNRTRIAGSVSVLGLVALVALPLAAQEEGGFRLTFGFSARVEAISNPGLTVPAEPDRTQVSSRLSFGLSDTTRRSAVALGVAGTLSTDNDDDSPDGLIDPDLNLSVRRIGATSSVELAAFLRETDLDQLRIQILDPDTGDISGDLLGDGTQRQTGGSLTLTFGDSGPWGGTLTAGLTDTTYTGTTTEVDNTRSNLGGTLRFQIDPATEVTTGLRWSRYKEEGAAARDTLRSEVGVRRDLRAGLALASVFAEDTEDGTRLGFSVGRAWELPGTSLSFSLGATRGVNGDVTPTGRLDWQKDLARGSIIASLRHDVTAGDDDRETVVTAASLGLSHELSPLSSVNFGLDASESEAVDASDASWNAALSATYTHSLPYDWALDAGAVHRIRKEDGTPDATSNTIFLELRRAIEWR